MGNFEKKFDNLKIDGEKLKKLQNNLLTIIKDVDYVCRKNNIFYSLSGGTCLGAVRHKGFIPWDDDADILIFGKDKFTLFTCLLNEFPDKYEILDFEYNHSLTPISKIILKGTKKVEIIKQNWPVNHGIFLDVFPFEDTSRNTFFRKHRARKLKLLNSMFLGVMFYKYTPTFLLEQSKTNPVLKRQIKKRKFLGGILSIHKPEYYLKKINKLHHYGKYSGLVCVPSTPNGYNREVFKKDDVCETTDVVFENCTFKILKNYDM